MTPEAQRIAIAEASPSACYQNAEGEWMLRGAYNTVFNPLKDLNAMHEAEKTVPHLPYLYRLQEVCGDRMETSGDLAKIIRATAAQRAEAFLRCIGKWTE